MADISQADLSQLSDDELHQIAQGAGFRESETLTNSLPDMSHLSDAELQQIAGHPDDNRSMWQKFTDNLSHNWHEMTRDRSKERDQVLDQMKQQYQDSGDAASGAGAVHGATLGYEPQILGATRVGIDKIADMAGVDPKDYGFDGSGKSYTQYRDDIINKRNQMKEGHEGKFLAGNLAGGAALGLATGGGAVPTSVGQAMKSGAIGGALYGALSNPGDTEGKVDYTGQLGDRLVNAAIGVPVGATMGAGFYGAGKGLAAVGNALQTKPKENAAEIAAAARALGFEPTPGMTTEGLYTGGTESSLSQSPSIAGSMMRRKIQPVRTGLNDAANKTLEDASFGLQPFESGELAKNQVLSQVGERAQPLQMSYDDLAESTRHAMVNPRSTQAVGRNIENLPEAQLMPSSSWAAKAAQYAEGLQNAKSVQDLATLRTLVGQDLKASQGPERQVLGQIYEKITNLRQRALLEASRQAAANPGQGERIGRDLVQQLKDTDEGWRSMMSDLGGFAKNARLGEIGSPRDFTEAVTGIRSEDMANRLFNPKDQRLVQDFQQKFPEAFETLRQAKLAQLAKMAEGPDGNVSPQKLVKVMDSLGLSPEMKGILLKGNASIPDNLSTVVHSLPEKIGPSGTPQGESFKQDWSPWFQAKELGRYGMYKASTSGGGNNLAQRLMQTPRFADMARKNPGAFQMMVNGLGGRMGQSAPRDEAPPANEDQRMSMIPEPPQVGQSKFVNGN